MTFVASSKIQQRMMVMRINKQSGVTLIELTVVLLILVALAGVVIPYVGGTSSAAMCKATDVTMQNVKKAIMERYYLDTLGKFPQDLDATLSGTSTPDYNLHYLFSGTNPSGTRTHKLFDPATQTGWRQGGYLQNGVVLNPNYIDGNSDNGELATTLKTYFISGDIVTLDAWGRPVVLQVSTCASWNIVTSETNCARLVSAGAGSGIAINEADIGTPINGNRITDTNNVNFLASTDDRILYLNAPTPAADVNPSCDE